MRISGLNERNKDSAESICLGSKKYLKRSHENGNVKIVKNSSSNETPTLPKTACRARPISLELPHPRPSHTASHLSCRTHTGNQIFRSTLTTCRSEYIPRLIRFSI